MAEFHRHQLDDFLAIVRKYMQLRGNLSQKDLAEKTDVGVSTMSRFLTQKSSELNPQLIAKMTAKLEIPLHEMIEFVDENYVERFKRLVQFYKNESNDGLEPNFDEASAESQQSSPPKLEMRAKDVKLTSRPEDLTLKEKLESLTPRQKAFMSEFLNLKLEERDLVVDVGNNLLQYFKMKGMNL